MVGQQATHGPEELRGKVSGVFITVGLGQRRVARHIGEKEGAGLILGHPQACRVGAPQAI
jgi:hypothetical protein